MKKNKNLYKSLVCGIVMLFIGTVIIPSNSGNNLKNTNLLIERDSALISGISNELVIQNNKINFDRKDDSDVNIEKLSTLTSQEITILEDGSAYLSIIIDVSSPKLINLYREAFGIPLESTEIDMEIPTNTTRIMEIDQKGNISTVEIIEPVRKRFYESIAIEQMHLFGFRISEFHSSRIISNNIYNSMRIIIEASADPYYTKYLENKQNVELVMSSAPSSSVNDFIYSQLDITRAMLLSFPGNQVFEKSWDITIFYPDKTSEVNAEIYEGNLDLGGCSYIQTNVYKESNDQIGLYKTWMLTEKAFEKENIDIDKTFSIEFSIPKDSVINIERFNHNFNHGSFSDYNFEWEIDWDIIHLNDTVEYHGATILYDIKVNLNLTLEGTLHVDILGTCGWVYTSVTAGLNVSAYISGEYEETFSLTEWLPIYSTRTFNWNGGIPIVLTPHVEPVAELTVSVLGEVNVYIHPVANFWFKAGGDLDFKWGWPPWKFKRIWDYGLGGELYKDFDVSASVTVRPSLGFAFSVLVFEIIGPRVEPRLYLEGTLGYDSNLGGNGIFWHAVLGFDIFVGLQLTRFLHWNWPDPIVNVILAEWDSEEDLGYVNPVDIISPVTNLTLTPKVNGWTSNNTRFWFEAIDPGADASGLDSTVYNIPSVHGHGNYHEFDFSLNHSILVSGPDQLYESLYFVSYYSIDKIGNKEDTNTEWVNVDLLPPVSEISVGEPSSGNYVCISTPISLDATDQGTGEWMIFYRIWYDGGWSDWNNNNLTEFSIPITLFFNNEGKHYLEWFAIDGVWNCEFDNKIAIHNQTFYVYGENNYLVADANGPYYAEAGESITFDASGSYPSEIITGYRWDWTNDGIWDTDWLSSPITITDDFSINGLYLAKLEVKDGDGEIDTAYSAVHIGVDWNLDVVETEGEVGPHNSISVDSNNHPHFCYQKFEMMQPSILKYAFWNGNNWIREQIDTNVCFSGWHSDAIVVGSNNRPHIAYGYYGAPPYSDELKYAYRDESGWHIDTVDSQEAPTTNIDIALDSNNYPHISYQMGVDFHSQNYLRYAYWNGNQWQTETIPLPGDDTGYKTSIAVDAYNRPHIICYDKENDCIRYTRKNGGSWLMRIIEDNPGENTYDSIAIDSDNNPHVCYTMMQTSNDPRKLRYKYSYDEGSSWTSHETIDNTDDANGGMSCCNMVIDKNNDYAHISYEKYENSISSLWYASKPVKSNWAIELIDNFYSTFGNSIAVDTNGIPHISYCSWIGYKDLRYTTLADGINSDPIANAGGGPGGRDTTYYSNSNEPIVFNAAEGFDFDGNLVRFRWDWTNDGIWDTPDGLGVPIVNHSYSDSGSYTVKVEVLDDWGATVTATASVEISNSPPEIPSNPSPFEGVQETGVNNNISWKGGDPDNGDTITYNIYFDKNSNPSYNDSISKPASQKTIEWDPGSLDYNSTYYWKIIADDNNGEIVEGEIWQFKTKQFNYPPNTISAPSPANESIDINLNTDLIWNSGDLNIGDVVTYDIYFGTDPNPPYITTIGPYLAIQTIITWDPGALNNETKYYWKIIAYDNQGAFVEGSIWEFTTGSTYPILCGDMNNDGVIQLSDMTYIISYLYIDGPHPMPNLCVGDVNGDGFINIADMTYIISYLYGGGPAPHDNCCDEWIFMCGDCNNDGEYNFDDFYWLMAYLHFGGDEPPLMCQADVDGNDIVDNADLVYIYEQLPPVDDCCDPPW